MFPSSVGISRGIREEVEQDFFRLFQMGCERPPRPFWCLTRTFEKSRSDWFLLPLTAIRLFCSPMESQSNKKPFAAYGSYTNADYLTGHYRSSRLFTFGDRVASQALPGFELDLDEVFGEL